MSKFDKVFLIVGIVVIVALLCAILVIDATPKNNQLYTKMICSDNARDLEYGVNQWLDEHTDVDVIDFDYYYFETNTFAQINYYCYITYKGKGE